MKEQGCFAGCLTLVIGLVVLALALTVIKWMGIPAGAAIAGFAYIQFRRIQSDPDGVEETFRSLGWSVPKMRKACIAGMAVGAVLIMMSAALLLNNVNDSEQRPAATGVIPAAYHGTWAADGDCGNTYSRIEVTGEAIDMPGLGFFDARTIVSETADTITFRGATIAGSVSQNDTVRLSLIDGRLQMVAGSMSPNGAMLRCSD